MKSLKIITSPHRGGKTSYITEFLRESIENHRDDKPFPIFLVPEQFHFETEHRLYKELGARLIGKVNITSFTKLSKVILTKYKMNQPYADIIVKEILLQKTLQKLPLKYYKQKSISKLSLRLMPIINDLQIQGILPSELVSMADSITSQKLKETIKELGLIYSEYSHTITHEFRDKPNDTLSAAILAKTHDYFKETEIYIDGFDGFSGSQLRLITEMMKASLTIAISADIKSHPRNYRYTENLIQALSYKAKKLNIKTQRINIPFNFTPPIVETNLYTAPDVYSECDFIAASIRKLITHENYRLSDIAVLCADKGILSTLEFSLNLYNVKYFSDIPVPIIEKPLVRFILTAIEAASLNPEALIPYIMSGFVRININTGTQKRGKHLIFNHELKDIKIPSPSFKNKSVRMFRRDMDGLETAQKLWQLKSSDWRNPFPESNKILFDLEPLRKDITDKLTQLNEGLKNSTGDKMTMVLADFFINKLEVPRTISSIINKRSLVFKKGYQIDRELNDEYRQIWETIVSVFESLYAALKDYEISVSNYLEILRSVFKKTETARPPQVIDAVILGDIKRTHPGKVKIVFISGANRNKFPVGLKTSGEFSAVEIETLIKAGIELKDDLSSKYYRERFLVHKAINIPSEKLYITAPLYSADGKTLEKSHIFDEQVKLKKLTVQSTSDLPMDFWVTTEKAARLSCSRYIGDPKKRSVLLEVLKKTNKKSADLLYEQFKERFNQNNYKYKLTTENASDLMKTHKISPSSVTDLYSCRFKYFFERGLGIKTRQIENDAGLNPSQKGRLIHYCLENILSAFDDYNEFINLDVSEIKILVINLINDFIENILSPAISRTKRQEWIIKTYLPHIVKLLTQTQTDMKFSKFRPLYFEKKVLLSIGNLNISGIIDRIDLLTIGSKNYLKIIDYKTGVNSFSFPSLYYGLGWQVLLYMYSFQETENHPSAAIYESQGFGSLSPKSLFPTNSKLQSDKKVVAANWLDQHRKKGVVVSDSKENELCEDFENIKKAQANYTGTRAEYVTFNLISLEDNKKLKEFFRISLNSVLDLLLNGDISAIPVSEKSKVPCTYCDFMEICENKGKKEIRKVDDDMIYNEVLK